MTHCNISDFDVTTLEDELRVDSLCRDLLMNFYHERINAGLDEHDATLLANSADYFIRDYVIGFRQLNILKTASGLVRSFAGNWYIVNTLEPTAKEIEGHLRGIREFYHFLRREGAIDDGFLATIDRECSDQEYYSGRIESFWNIKGDGYYEWESECSLKQRP
ncbi:MAG TPA: hypothetical protein VFF53_01395 [Geobacteraceae bacterium]|nr:hypothetical protein [Geobacteraceae bacterium]